MKKGAFYLTISSFVFMLTGYVINVWLGRHLGPNDYGIYGVIMSLVTVINLTQTDGLPLAVSKYVAANKENAQAVYKSGFYLQILSTLLITIIFFLCSSIIANILNDPELIPYIQLASLIFPLYGLFALTVNYYNGLRQFKKQATLHIIYSIAKVITILLGAFLFKLYGVLLGFIISPIIAIFTGLRLPNSNYSFPYKKLLYFSIPLVGIAIFSNLLQSFDIFFVKAIMQSNEKTGYYTASQNISKIPFYALSALSVVLLPSISNSVSLNLIDKTKKLINQSQRAIILLCLPLILIMSATSKELVMLIYSNNYIPAAESLSILVIGMGLITIFTVQSNILNGAGYPKLPLLIAVCGVILTAILNYLLIPILGLSGAALATTCGGLTVLILTSIIIYRKFKTLVSVLSIVKIVIASVIIYSIAKLISVNIYFLPIWYVLLFTIYFSILFLIKEIRKDDLNLIGALIPNRIKDKLKK